MVLVAVMEDVPMTERSCRRVTQQRASSIGTPRELLPRWCGLLLIAWIACLPLIFFLVDFYGEARALFGLVFLALGHVLWSRRETIGGSHETRDGATPLCQMGG